MAKKRAGQQKLDGMEDAIPDEVRDKVDEYVKKLRLRQRTQESENSLRREVLTLMEEHGLKNVPLSDDDEKVLSYDEGQASVHIKKRQLAPAVVGADDDEDEE